MIEPINPITAIGDNYVRRYVEVQNAVPRIENQKDKHINTSELLGSIIDTWA